MEIQINQESKKWLQRKGKPLIIKSLQVGGCCAPPVHEFMTRFGTPKDIKSYKEFKIDNLSIFVEKSLLTFNTLEIKLSGMGVFKTISVKIK